MSYPPPGGYGGGSPQAAPESNMGISIASLVVGLLCGCILTAIPGIMALVQANKVQGLAQAGQYGAAKEAADKARRYAIIGFVVTAVVFLLVVGIYVLAFALADDNTTNAIAAF